MCCEPAEGTETVSWSDRSDGCKKSEPTTSRIYILCQLGTPMYSPGDPVEFAGSNRTECRSLGSC